MELAKIASGLMEALDRGVLLPPISDRLEPFAVDDGYALAAELVRRRRARGERTIGRKLGFTNRALWDLLGVDAPFWAYVYDTTVTFLGADSGSVAIAQMTQPRLEPELVLHFAGNPSVAAGEFELTKHIDWIAPAFEIVQCHFPDWHFRTPDAIADFGVHGALLVGPPAPLAAMETPLRSLSDFTISLSRNGVEVARGGGMQVLGNPLRALSQVMRRATTQAGWEPIGLGEIVTTGTLTGLHVLEPGEQWEIAVDGLPFGGLAVRID